MQEAQRHCGIIDTGVRPILIHSDKRMFYSFSGIVAVWRNWHRWWVYPAICLPFPISVGLTNTWGFPCIQGHPCIFLCVPVGKPVSPPFRIRLVHCNILWLSFQLHCTPFRLLRQTNPYLNVKILGWNIGSNWPMRCRKTGYDPSSRIKLQERVESQSSKSLTGLNSSLGKGLKLVAAISTLPRGFFKFSEPVIRTDLLLTSPKESLTLNTGLTSSCWASVCRKWIVISDVALTELWNEH